jgi:hypothetical protein
VQKARKRKQLTTLNWTTVDSDGSLFSRGKHDYYAIIIRGVPEDHPKDCVVELYVSDKEMTAFEIKVSADSEQLKPISRSIVWGDLPPVTKINQTVENMKETAESRENEMPNFNF